MEGVTGIDTYEMIQRDGKDFRRCCELLMDDVNAAVEGCFAGGASAVTVLDSHGGANNFIHEMLDARAQADPRANGKWWAGLDPSYAVTMFIGAHPMAGTKDGFLDHTQSSLQWFEYKINGQPVGELVQWATVAGNFGVPLVMVSGDAAACAEAKRFFDPVVTAVVKSGQGRNKAKLVPTAEAHARIREAARQAVSLAGKAKPWTNSRPTEYRVTYYRSDYCDGAAKNLPAWERIDARTIRRVSDSPLDLLPRR